MKWQLVVENIKVSTSEAWASPGIFPEGGKLLGETQNSQGSPCCGNWPPHAAVRDCILEAMVVREVNDAVIDLQDDVRGKGSCHNSAYETCEAPVRTFAMRQCNVMTSHRNCRHNAKRLLNTDCSLVFKYLLYLSVITLFIMHLL